MPFELLMKIIGTLYVCSRIIKKSICLIFEKFYGQNQRITYQFILRWTTIIFNKRRLLQKGILIQK